MTIAESIVELEKFSDKILTLGRPVAEVEIKSFENVYRVQLPDEYKELIRKYNGVELLGTEVYGIGKTGFGYDLKQAYLFEHYEVENAMFLHLVPFSPDGYGNHYCFDTRFADTGICPVVFWEHDKEYENEEQVEVAHPSFGAWLKEVMIDWTLEDYNYDGSEK